MTTKIDSKSETNLSLECSRTKSVLIVDDNPDHATLTREVLQDEDFLQIDIASNLTSAFNLITKSNYDILIVNYSLPDGYGTDLLDWVKRSTLTIVMTAHSDERVAVQSIKKGACDYVVKDALLRSVLSKVINQATMKASMT